MAFFQICLIYIKIYLDIKCMSQVLSKEFLLFFNKTYAFCLVQKEAHSSYYNSLSGVHSKMTTPKYPPFYDRPFNIESPCIFELLPKPFFRKPRNFLYIFLLIFLRFFSQPPLQFCLRSCSAHFYWLGIV